MDTITRMEIIQQRKKLECILIPHEAELKATQRVWEEFGDYAHRAMVAKLIDFLTPVRAEYVRFQKRYPAEVYPEIWI